MTRPTTTALDIAANGPTEGRPVVALHCSGMTGRQWAPLAERLRDNAPVHAPNLFGAPGSRPWHGGCEYSLAAEADPVIEFMAALNTRAHLVGHSFGGAVALHIAARRPDLVASLALYEPAAFHMLKSFNRSAAAALCEIRSLAADMEHALMIGASWAAAGAFVDYWNGAGAFAAAGPATQADLTTYAAKACLDFRALLAEDTPPVRYRHLSMPVMLISGEFARKPARQVTARLAAAMAGARLVEIAGAGHMGPATHAGEVAMLIANHVRRLDRMDPQPAAGGELAAAA